MIGVPSPGPERRLKLGLLAFALALLLPFATLVLHAWSQLRFETYFDYRNRAQALVSSIDRDLALRARQLETLAVDEFEFFRNGDDRQVRIRSQLSEMPPGVSLPGLLGYFQLSADSFSSPLLPPAETDPGRTGLSASELDERQRRTETLRRALTEIGARPAAPAVAEEAERAASGDAVMERPAEAIVTDAARQVLAPRRGETAAPSASAPRAQSNATALEQFSDRENAPAEDSDESDFSTAIGASRGNSLGKLGELRLDEALQQKSIAAESARNQGKEEEPAMPAATAANAPVDVAAELPVRDAAMDELRRDVGPFRFRILASGNAALFRDVWSNGERRVQGALLDLEPFVADAVAATFLASSLVDTATLVVGYGEEIIRIVDRREESAYPLSANDLTGTLLHEANLSAPFDGLRLVLSASSLPAGPGRAVLGWTAIAFTLVVLLGTLFMYRAGLRQVRLARQQQDFVSAVSHELKTPLTSIRMYGEMLRSGWTDEGKRARYYDYIHDESERLTRLIDNVLQLSRISRGTHAPEPRDVTGAELADLVRSKIAARVERAGYELRINVAPAAETASVHLDPDGFVQVAINLVDNAIKFSRNSGNPRIDVSIDRADSRLGFRVRDYGPGVPDALRQRIFELFYRPDSSSTRETPGTGIGLAIVQMLVESMGGSVSVENRDPGAEFTVLLPIR